MSKFKEKYAKPDEVSIVMEDVTFHVQLPTSSNRRYERAVASCMTTRNDETGAFEVADDYGISEIFEAQHKAFLRSCVTSVDGLEFDPDQFFAEFPDAAEELYTKGMELASELEQEAASQAGKSQDTLSGQESGKGKKSSTLSLSSAAG
jgi:hypothetical protein